MAHTAEPWKAAWWDWHRVGWALLIWKVTYLGGVWVALTLWGEMEKARFQGFMMHWPREGPPIFSSYFATWDGAHYLFLSEEGYGPGVRSNAFYPLYPLLVRWVAGLTGGDHLLAGLLVANTCSLAGWVLFFEVARRRFGPETALWGLALLVTFPGSLFYQFVYTEGLFFLLVAILWMGLERGRYEWACVGAFLLPISRAVGLFCLLPITWHLLTRRPMGWMRRWKTDRWDSALWEPEGKSPAQGWSDASCYGLLLAPLAGWGVYLGLMWSWTGNAFAGFEAQRFWGAHSVWNLVNVPKFVMGLLNPTEWHAFQGSLLDRCAFMVLVYALVVIWRTGKDVVIWTYVLGIMPAMSGTFTSFMRFESMVFPLFIALAVCFAKPGRRWALGLLIAVSVTLHGWLLWRFLHFEWAG